MNHHDRQQLDIIALTNDHAMFLNKHGLILYQPSVTTEGEALEHDPDGFEYWMPQEALAMAEAVLARRAALLDAQHTLDAVLDPLVEIVLQRLGNKVEKLASNWPYLRLEAGYVLTKLFLEGHPCMTRYREQRRKTTYTEPQLENFLYRKIHQAVRKQYPCTVFLDEKDQETRVSANCYSDDRVIEVETFDATPWFEQASDEEILALRRCGFGGDDAADRVAEYAATYDREVQAMFDHNATLPETIEARGFECYVDRNEAEAWIEAFRPSLF